MKNFTLLFFIILVAFLPSCDRDKCDAYSGRVLSGRMETIFGAYKPGNSWIYHNRDSTKTDSVYIISFADSLLKDEVNCIVYGLRKFTLRSQQLAAPNDIAVVYDATSSGTGFTMESDGVTFPSFSSVTDSLIQSLPANENPGDNMLDSVQLNGSTYYNILKGVRNPNVYYFGRGLGLVGWITPVDTFSLVRYKIL